MKKLVSVLLAVLVAAGVFVPAMAAGEAASNAPILTWVHSNPTSPDNRIARGETLVLEISAELPEGSQGELSYKWLAGDSLEKLVGIGPQLELVIDNELISPPWNPSIYVRVEVTNTYTDENGEERTITEPWGMLIHVAPRFPWTLVELFGKILNGIATALVMIVLAPIALSIPVLLWIGFLPIFLLNLPAWLWNWITGLFS